MQLIELPLDIHSSNEFSSFQLHMSALESHFTISFRDFFARKKKYASQSQSRRFSVSLHQPSVLKVKNKS